METATWKHFPIGVYKNKYVCNPMTIATTQKKCTLLIQWGAQGKFQVQGLSKEIKSKPVGAPQYTH